MAQIILYRAWKLITEQLLDPTPEKLGLLLLLLIVNLLQELVLQHLFG